MVGVPGCDMFLCRHTNWDLVDGSLEWDLSSISISAEVNMGNLDISFPLSDLTSPSVKWI